MDNAPRHLGRVKVPNPRYYTADNAALPSKQPPSSAANVMDVATVLAASAASVACGTSITSHSLPLEAAAKAPIARKATTVSAATLAHYAPTSEVRQLSFAELLAVAAPAAVRCNPATCIKRL